MERGGPAADHRGVAKDRLPAGQPLGRLALPLSVTPVFLRIAAR